MLPIHVALVPEYVGCDTRELLRVAAAIQRQIARDVAPLWNVMATVSAFEHLEDVPIGYWPIVLTTRALEGQDGTHLDANGSPYALVEAQPHWSVVASHECVEMLVDPFGNRLVTGPNPRGELEGRVEFLLEVCDPCQADDSSYLVDDVLVADFVTPAYYGGDTTGARYSFSGRLKSPFEIAEGGYLSWRDPATGSWWQRAKTKGGVADTELGPLEPTTRGQRSAREMIDGVMPHHRQIARSIAKSHVARAAERAAAGREASARKATSLRSHVRSLAQLGRDPQGAPGSALATLPVGRVTPPAAPSPELEKQIAAAIVEVEAKATLPDRDAVLTTLRSALTQAERIARPTKESDKRLLASTALAGAEERELAIVQSAMRSPLAVPSRSLLTGKEIAGFAPYETLNAGWIATVWNHIFRSTVPFLVAPTPEAVITRLPARATIAIAGDWGTGDPSSRTIAERIAEKRPTHTIHLGDVYYSGTESEETDHLIALWPRGSVASFTLNSNHEMYSGGHGYFDVALKSELFEAQKGYSYFALVNDDWVILGLDSAYAATKFYQEGALNDAQVAWLKQLRATGCFVRAGGGRKKLLVLSHHEGIDLATGAPKETLWGQVTGALEVGPDYWYWGHEHGVAVFRPKASGGLEVRGRLVGHGGVPYIADPITGWVEWTEDGAGVGPAIDPKVPQRSRNGFALLQIDGAALTEELWDERGERRWGAGP